MCYIVGGLGNQLFCYSAGYYLSQRNESQLELRLFSGMNSTRRDQTLLPQLNLPGKFKQVGKNPIKELLHSSLMYKFLSSTCLDVNLQKRVVSKSLGYDRELEQTTGSVYLQGYFQTWRYAQHSRELILNALKSNVILSDYGASLIDTLNSEQSFIVHIRLGDYKKEENSYFGILSPNYYENLLSKHNPAGMKVFVFSDDIEFAQSQYATSFPSNAVWVDIERKLSTLETLYIMLHGCSFAIANSTFSWWAAFLSEKKQLVVAPSKWFKEHEDPIDLIPINWVQEESIWQV